MKKIMRPSLKFPSATLTGTKILILDFIFKKIRNEKAKTRREYLAHQAELEEKRKKEVEMDYLAPFLAQLGHPKSFTKEDVAKLTRDCLEGKN